MPIIKNRTQSNFTQISNGILRDQKLPMKERGVLCTLLSFPDKWKFSVEGLSAIVPDGRDSLNHAINNLIERQKIIYLSDFSRFDIGNVK